MRMRTLKDEMAQLRLSWPQWGWYLSGGKIAGRVQLGASRVAITVEAGPEAWRAVVTGEGYEGAGVAACAVDAVLGASRALRAALREAK